MSTSVRDALFNQLNYSLKQIRKMYGENKTLSGYIEDLEEEAKTLHTLTAVVDDEYSRRVISE